MQDSGWVGVGYFNKSQNSFIGKNSIYKIEDVGRSVINARMVGRVWKLFIIAFLGKTPSLLGELYIWDTWDATTL